LQVVRRQEEDTIDGPKSPPFSASLILIAASNVASEFAAARTRALNRSKRSDGEKYQFVHANVAATEKTKKIIRQ